MVAVRFGSVCKLIFGQFVIFFVSMEGEQTGKYTLFYAKIDFAEEILLQRQMVFVSIVGSTAEWCAFFINCSYWGDPTYD